jgi:hypothetical protein
MSSAPHPSVFAAMPQTTQRTVTREHEAAGVPWYIWTGVVGITSAFIGGEWDVSWHRSIGRDSFWTPAHLMIQLCGVLAAVVGLWLVYQCTFNKESPLREASVSMFGLRAPLGVFLAGWGGVAMITSAPFDNWWHAAYGLDVKIVSPPHTLLILGIRAVGLGVFFLILATMNRAAEQGQSNFTSLQRLLLYLGGLTVAGQMFFLQEYTWDIALHQSRAYIALAIAVPMAFALISQASRFRWAATTTAAIYTGALILEILIFPLVSAEPKLGPVFNPITHLIPAKFPVLILLPAIALDLLWQRTKSWKMWQVALVSGFVFVAVLVAVEWPFATFLMTKASENRFFGTIYFDYNAPPDGIDRIRQFFHPGYGMPLYFGLLRAAIYGGLSTALGLMFGRWMRGVQR